MAKAESSPQAAVVAADRAQLWVSKVILSPLNASAPASHQQLRYPALAAGEQHKAIQRAGLSVTGDRFKFWGFSAMVEADNGITVMHKSVESIVASLTRLDLDIAELDFVDANIASMAQLHKDSINTSQEIALIDMSGYPAVDSLRHHAADAFNAARDLALERTIELANVS